MIVAFIDPLSTYYGNEKSIEQSHQYYS
uniref:Uncharacterized protein n=1 Tax=Rhizophora mucronata TaxID=61149 RepID=A0A2P2KMN2_RHIMU